MLKVGLNPYGLCCAIGLVGQGTGRGAPEPLGLEGFVQLGLGFGVRCLEMDSRLLLAAEPGVRAEIAQRLQAKGIEPIVATGPPGDHLGPVIEMAGEVGASLIRMSLTSVLCGARATTPDWEELVRGTREALCKWAPVAASKGIDFAIENHQDFVSEELLEMALEAGDNVGICFDTGNPLAVGEDVLAFTRRIAGRIRHVHFKDYRAQFTDEGIRLVRCAIGDGCVPLPEIVEILLPHRASLTASLEPGALEARHIKLFTKGWWNGYPPRAAQELAQAMETARRNMLADGDEWRTPWELERSGEEIVDFEMGQVKKSVDNMKQLGWL